uniref:Anti-sigma factor antagonist n=1 Tax=uncultured bacterium Ele16D6 TaxID=1340030 RepID=W5RBF9_9BACT|nr:hypothetical protein [uncultured bacterium Ele16D6]
MKVVYLSSSEERVEIALQGELNTVAAQQFAIDIEPIMDEAHKEIVVDFSMLEFISSAGMRSLLVLNKAAKEKGGKVVITGASEDIKQIFGLTGFDALFEMK